ncbi:MAG: DinB family protein [Acidobacteriota bacterium]
MLPAAKEMSSELAQESLATRRVLERVPDDRFDWQPHAKSMTMGQLAIHVARLPGRFALVLAMDGLEIVPPVPPPAPPPAIATSAALLEEFDRGVAAAQAFLAGLTEETASGPWRMTHTGREVFTLPRLAAFRRLLLNHTYHHRGQLTVYLRLLDVLVPAVYGRSADEDGFAAAAERGGMRIG